MMAYRLVECAPPNHDARDASVDMLVLHYTGMKTGDEALARLTDPAAKVSAHYTIGRDGRVYRHVPEDRRAWHAGVSYWAGARNINSRSIGIELVNPGHEFGYVPFTDEQIAALIDIAQEIIARHAIAPARVSGDSGRRNLMGCGIWNVRSGWPAFWRRRARCRRTRPRQMAGWPRSLAQSRFRGKSGLHGNTVTDNIRRGKPQGKCNRKQTADRRKPRQG